MDGCGEFVFDCCIFAKEEMKYCFLGYMYSYE